MSLHQGTVIKHTCQARRLTPRRFADQVAMERHRPTATTFAELTNAHLTYAYENKRSWDRGTMYIEKLSEVFGVNPARGDHATVESYNPVRAAGKII
jgi:hypothetical protein